MITGESSDSQPPETAGGQSSTPAVQKKGAVLALASEQATGRSKKRPRKDQAEQHLVDEDSTEHPSTDLGEQTDQLITEPSVRSSAPPVWSLEMKYKGRAVITADSVYADKDYSFGFNMTKGLLLPADMKKHEELSDLKVIRSAAKSIVLAAQKNYLAHERMIAMRQSVRDASTDNKAKTIELEKLKATQEEAVAERDRLVEWLARADEDKKNALQVTKARYIAELHKLHEAHKAEGEKAYERQVQGTKDIFFQCGWKAAVEKLGLGQDSDMLQNLLVAFIPVHMQAYASAVQKKLIEEAQLAAAAEASPAQLTD
ncbi:hypothetical protein CsSME_00003091 [Camellia sinensis var. sinensis]